jgi:Abnormal spindle-like microcephaly-assoc'd, ASPM-SPD-2-Hydin
MKSLRLASILGMLLVALMLPIAAHAAVKALPNDPLTGFPFAYQDDVGGFALGLCMDGDANKCIGAPVPNRTEPYMVPDNFTPDEEAFWWRADAAFPPPFDKALVEFAQEAAFATPGINAGQQIAFSRIRFARFPTSGPDALKPLTWYRFSHPYGVDDVQTDVLGQLTGATEDAGCIGPPCNFAAAPQGRVTSFLTWDPEAPAAPTGYIGDPLVEHTVIGSPIDRNSVTVEEMSGKGGSVVKLITKTDQFFVMGKLSGPPPAPAPFAIVASQSLTFDAREVEDIAPAQTVTVTNRGVLPLQVTGATMSGANPTDFIADLSTCAAAVAPGASCTLAVGFAPTAVGARSGTLTITHNARNGAKSVALAGTGTTPHQLKVLSARFANKGYGRNGKGGFSLAKFKAQGLNMVLGLEPGTGVLRVRVLRVLPPKKKGGKERLRILLTDMVTPLPGAGGTSRLFYNPPALVAAARRGDFRVQIVPARRVNSQLGIPTRLDFTIDHR